MYYATIRILSLLVMVSMVILDWAFKPLTPCDLCFDVMCGIAVCLLFPSSYEDVTPSLVFALGYTALIPLLALLLIHSHSRNEVIFFLIIILNFVYAVYRGSSKFRNIRSLFRIDAVWCSVEDYARMFFDCVYAMLAILLLMAQKNDLGAWAFYLLLLMMLGFYLLVVVRAHTGKTFFLSIKKESEIKDIIRSNMAAAAEEAPEEHLNAVYTRVLRYMERKKPYLVDGFNVEDLAEGIFCNRSYVSKAINYYYGRNFKQFVNYYRVCYAIELMRRDRRIKVIDLAMMSGFHSVVSFNMAFKLFMNTTPSAYSAQLHARENASKSNKQRTPALKPIPIPPQEKS